MLEPLTSFRFVAALMVFAQHSMLFAGVTEPYELGYAGVSFFFVLSGFILTYVYHDKLGRGGRGRIKKFCAARIAKLCPLQALTLLAASGLPAVISQLAGMFTSHAALKTAGVGLLQLSMTQSFYPSYNVAITFNIPAWSVSTEFFFYLMFPLLIFLFVKYRKKLTTKVLLAGWLIMWAALMFYLTTPYATPTSSHDFNVWFLYMFPLRRLFDFAFGMVLGLSFLRAGQSGKSAHKLFSKAGTKLFTAAELAVMAMIGTALALSVNLPHTMRFGAFLMPFWGLLIFVFAWQKGLVSRLMSLRPLVFLGSVSFSFYMIHGLVLGYVGSVNHRIILSFVIAMGLSSVCYIFFEEPARLRLKAYLENVNMAKVWVKLRLWQRRPSQAPSLDVEDLYN
jgi:peptidoglycan/LPS O-acetylase OafA/YrhL